MKLADILAKIAKGDALTDEEKKKAEKEAKDAKDALERLQGEFDECKAANDPGKKQSELEKALARISKLEQANKDKEAQIAARDRTARIRALAKEAGINPAKGVSSETLDLLVDNLMAKVDIDDADAVKAAFDGFKTSNAGLIAAGTIGGAGQKGTPGAGAYTGANPFSKKTFNLSEQLKLRIENPEIATQLEQAAASEN